MGWPIQAEQVIIDPFLELLDSLRLREDNRPVKPLPQQESNDDSKEKAAQPQNDGRGCCHLVSLLSFLGIHPDVPLHGEDRKEAIDQGLEAVIRHVLVDGHGQQPAKCTSDSRILTDDVVSRLTNDLDDADVKLLWLSGHRSTSMVQLDCVFSAQKNSDRDLDYWATSRV